METISDPLRHVSQYQALHIVVRVTAMAETNSKPLTRGHHYGYQVVYQFQRQPLNVHKAAFQPLFAISMSVFISFIADQLHCYASQAIVMAERPRHHHHFNRRGSDID